MKRGVLCALSFVLIICLLGCREEQNEKPTLLQNEEPRQIILNEVYLECEHRSVLEGEARPSAESEEELLKAYPGYKIDDFQPKQAVLVQYKKGKCDEHILFKEYRGKIGVFRENNGALLDVLDVTVSQLRQRDRKILKDGVSVFGKEECAAFWDDFAS